MAVTLRQCLEKFLEHVANVEREDESGDSILTKEYAELVEISRQYRSERTFPTNEGDKPCNSKKNRYKDILPFDYTRVSLPAVDKVPGSDYINANYIKGIDGENSYIASQGPLPATVNDFWRMAWNEKCNVIIMACMEIEAGRPKCHRYWSKAVGKTEKFGDIAVTLESEKSSQQGDFVARVLQVKYDGTQREVRQYHYQAWPDHGVTSSVTPILDMIAQARTYHSESTPPMLVHCSAGCGRTGTICSIDYAWNLLKKNNISLDFNMRRIIAEMRKQRPSIVQSADQYCLAHMAVVELFQRHIKEFDKYIQSQQQQNEKLKIDSKQDAIEDEVKSVYENWSITKEALDDIDSTCSSSEAIIKDTVQQLYHQHRADILPTDSNQCNAPESSTATSKLFRRSTNSQDESSPPTPSLVLKDTPRRQSSIESNSGRTPNGSVVSPKNATKPPIKPKSDSLCNGDASNSGDNSLYATPHTLENVTPPKPPRTSACWGYLRESRERDESDEVRTRPPVVPVKMFDQDEVKEELKQAAAAAAEAAAAEAAERDAAANDYTYVKKDGNNWYLGSVARKAAEEEQLQSSREAIAVPPSATVISAGDSTGAMGKRPQIGEYSSVYTTIGESASYDNASRDDLTPSSPTSADGESEADVYACVNAYGDMTKDSMRDNTGQEDDVVFEQLPGSPSPSPPTDTSNIVDKKKEKKKKDKSKDEKSGTLGFKNKLKGFAPTKPFSNPPKAISAGNHTVPQSIVQHMSPAQVLHKGTKLSFPHRVDKPKGSRQKPADPPYRPPSPAPSTKYPTSPNKHAAPIPQRPPATLPPPVAAASFSPPMQPMHHQQQPTPRIHSPGAQPTQEQEEFTQL